MGESSLLVLHILTAVTDRGLGSGQVTSPLFVPYVSECVHDSVGGGGQPLWHVWAGVSRICWRPPACSFNSLWPGQTDQLISWCLSIGAGSCVSIVCQSRRRDVSPLTLSLLSSVERFGITHKIGNLEKRRTLSTADCGPAALNLLWAGSHTGLLTTLQGQQSRKCCPSLTFSGKVNLTRREDIMFTTSCVTAQMLLEHFPAHSEVLLNWFYIYLLVLHRWHLTSNYIRICLSWNITY